MKAPQAPTQNKLFSYEKPEKCVEEVKSSTVNKRYSDYQHPKKKQPESPSKSIKHEKVVITGDDILIEYVARVIERLSKSHYINNYQFECANRFINHQVWNVQD